MWLVMFYAIIVAKIFTFVNEENLLYNYFRLKSLVIIDFFLYLLPVTQLIGCLVALSKDLCKKQTD